MRISVVSVQQTSYSMTYSVRKRKPEEGKVVLDYLLDNCAKFPNKIFLTQPMGGEVINFTFIEFLSESKKMAAHIESLNLPVPSQIAIMSKNCAWWLMADLAIMMTGHVSVPIYPTLTAETVKYTLEHSESQLLFVGKLDTRLWNEMIKKCLLFYEDLHKTSTKYGNKNKSSRRSS